MLPRRLLSTFRSCSDRMFRVTVRNRTCQFSLIPSLSPMPDLCSLTLSQCRFAAVSLSQHMHFPRHRPAEKFSKYYLLSPCINCINTLGTVVITHEEFIVKQNRYRFCLFPLIRERHLNFRTIHLHFFLDNIILLMYT